MGLQLHRIDDPRDTLNKARRLELRRFARANGITHVPPGHDDEANLLRLALRQRGLTNIRIPHRPLGQLAMPSAVPDAQVSTVSAEAELRKKLEALKTQSAPQPVQKSFEDMSVGELRAEAKRRGIKQKHGEGKVSLRAKLNGHPA